MTGPTNNPESYYVYDGAKTAITDSLSFDENGKLETTATLEAQSVDVTVGDVDLTGDSLSALQSINTKTYDKKGSITVAHNAITTTATSATINCTGFNACLVSVNISGTGTWKCDIYGKFTSDGTMMPIYDNVGNLLSTGNTSSSLMQLFTAIPDYIEVIATEIADGATLTVKTQPINI